ncbi:hypothetical protein [Streptomyces sp. NBC_01508]|uniref:hypothetical protein n=1 Tax=Streptomyces sp. NBC_01508 TaxID=2903888 RepID=UPI00386DF4B8
MFPETALPIQVDFQIDGAWEDHTDAVYSRGDIVITRGRSDEAQSVSPGRCAFQLNNRDGKYSPRNPLSPLYGKIGPGTPMRVSVRAGTPYLEIPGGVNDRASTPDTAALDITGDLDVRVEARILDWEGAVNAQELMGKWASAGQRSWCLFVYRRSVWFYHSTDGTAQSIKASTEYVAPTPTGRLAVRATLDVNNGASGHTVTFYTAPTLDGPWEQLGNPIIGSGTTSVFNSTSPVSVGNFPNAFATPTGAFYRAEVRNGIGGTVVANPVFTTQTVGATSFVDAAGRTWSMSGNAAISNRKTRFVGEVPDWPLDWDTSGEDVWCDIEAAGVLRRLGTGVDPLKSTLARRIPTYGPVAYWPLEDGETSTQAYSPIEGVRPMRTTGFDFASDDTLPGAASVPTLGPAASMTGSVPGHASTGQWLVAYVYKMDAAPASATTILEFTSTGTCKRIVVRVDSNSVDLTGYNSDGDQVLDFGFNTVGFAFYGIWNRLEISAVQTGSNTEFRIQWANVESSGFTGTTTITATAGTVTRVGTAFGALAEGMRLSHLGVFNTASNAAYEAADDGFAREEAGIRMQRLATEEQIPVAVRGRPTDAERLGPQRPGTFLGLVKEAADADHGILYEDREQLGLVYQTRSGLYNQPPVATLVYGTDLMPGLRPVDDDQSRSNRWTVTRIGGSSGIAEQEEGRLSVQAPPLGVGPYPDSASLSLGLDTQTAQHAGWLVHLGTVDEPRYPLVNVALQRNTTLIEQVTALDTGCRLDITNPAAKLAPGDIGQVVQGYTETLSQYVWSLAFNCTPASPYTVGVLEDPDLSRADTAGSVLATAETSTATVLAVHTDSETSPRWVDSAGFLADFPFDVTFGGEVATVTGILNVADTFTRTTAGTWGTSSSGVVWNEAGGLAADRTVNGTRGVITLASSVSSLRFQELLAEPIGDCEVRVRLSVSAVATGASLVPGVLLRCFSTSDYYRARIHFGVSGGMFVSITRDTTQIGASPTLPYTYAAGDEFELRVRLVGHTIQMRVWPVGTSEPAVWNHTETVITNPIPLGTIGVTGSAFTGMTLVNAQLRYDAFEIVTPQRFTVTRSVNGIVKPQTAGTDLRLAQPTIVSL